MSLASIFMTLSSLKRTPATSARPPVLQYGMASLDAIKTLITGLPAYTWRLLQEESGSYKTPTPFKTRYLGQFRHNLNMPVIVFIGLICKR